MTESVSGDAQQTAAPQTATPNPADGAPTAADQSSVVAGTPTTSLETAPAGAVSGTTNEPTDFTEDNPYESEVTQNLYWVKDGKTYRATRDGSQFVADGDVSNTLRALAALYPDRF